MSIAWAATIAVALLLLWSLLEGDAWRERGWAICAGASTARDRGVATRRAMQRVLFAAATLPILCGLAFAHDAAAPRTWLAAGLSLLVAHGLTIAATIDEGAIEIPDAITLPLLALALLAGGSGALDGTLLGPRGSLLGAGAGLALGSIVPSRRGLQAVGGADILLLGAIGAMTGLIGLAVTVLVAGLATLLLRPFLQRADGAYPYAPGLSLGFGIGIAAASYLSA